MTSTAIDMLSTLISSVGDLSLDISKIFFRKGEEGRERERRGSSVERTCVELLLL